jgi:hypothetical protein
LEIGEFKEDVTPAIHSVTVIVTEGSEMPTRLGRFLKYLAQGAILHQWMPLYAISQYSTIRFISSNQYEQVFFKQAKNVF